VSGDGHALITGGAGFVGTNLAHRLAGSGRNVLVLDDLSRSGAQRNLEWLLAEHPDRIRVRVASLLDAGALQDVVQGAREVYHLAAQVAVTSSLLDPLKDCDVNVRGTLMLLEALRRSRRPPSLVFTSTNKVYGALDDVPLRMEPRRYVPVDTAERAAGIAEQRRLDFHSPYGCSKGAADQYVLDYARCYGLRTIVFRMSCIYGPHQHGNEDQGWVAHFIRRAYDCQPLTIFGDGRQVRDVLYVDDLLEAFALAIRDADALAGRAFNLGGGPTNTLSLLELLDCIGERRVPMPAVQFRPWRNGDQRWYVSDTSAFSAATGWRARVPVRTGIARLCEWFSKAPPGDASEPLAVAAGQ
jgi:CDP-paratose 2-epimerase